MRGTVRGEGREGMRGTVRGEGREEVMERRREERSEIEGHLCHVQ